MIEDKKNVFAILEFLLMFVLEERCYVVDGKLIECVMGMLNVPVDRLFRSRIYHDGREPDENEL